MKPDYQVIACKTAGEWRDWLAAHGADTEGVWVRFYKKASGVATINYDEALENALCFGWIDGQVKSFDKLSYIQKFTPRRSKSLWSKRNIELVAKLTDTGRMTPAGLAEVQRAKADGRWDAAYDKPSEMVIPQEFLAELHKYPKAEKFFLTLNKANKYAVAWRLQTAKTEETRRRRQEKIIEQLKAGQKFH